MTTEHIFSEENLKLRTQSLPITTVRESVGELKTQTSAPFYLFSLKDNDLPPFRKPGREPKAKLLIGAFVTAKDIVDMITDATASEKGIHKYLTKKLIEKKIILNFEILENHFLLSFLSEAISYAARRDFCADRLSGLLSIYVNAHCYFKRYYWLPPVALWSYFKDILIRHALEDSPEGQEIFGPEEAYDILTHFHSIYMMNLPLIHIMTFGAYQLKLTWPFKIK